MGTGGMISLETDAMIISVMIVDLISSMTDAMISSLTGGMIPTTGAMTETTNTITVTMTIGTATMRRHLVLQPEHTRRHIVTRLPGET